MNLETVIQEKVHALPIVKQEKVLAFVEDLEEKIELDDNGNQDKKAADFEKEVERFSIIGIGRSKGKGDVSRRAEEILAEEIDKHSGWTLKEKIVAD